MKKRTHISGLVLSSMLLSGTFVATIPVANASPIGGTTILTAAERDGGYTFQWDETSGASAYRIEISADPLFSQKIEAVDTYSRTYSSRVDLKSTAARTIYWRVAAYSNKVAANSLGDWSAVQSFGVSAADSPIISTPENSEYVNYPDTPNFRWSAVPGATNYQFEYVANGSQDFSTNSTSVTVASRGYTMPTPLAAGDWSWRVRAVLYSGGTTQVFSPWSNAHTFSVGWNTSDSMVNTVYPTQNANVSDPKFTWDSVAGASNYNLVVSRAEDMSNPIVNVVTPKTSYIPPNNLLNGAYYWKVTAQDLSGNYGSTPVNPKVFTKTWGMQAAADSASSIAEATPTTTEGFSTSPVTPTAVPLDELKLSWNPIPRATYYKVVIDNHSLNATSHTSNASVPVITCKTASTELSFVYDYVAGTQGASWLKGSGQCTNLSRRQKNYLAEGGVFSYQVQGIDYNGHSTTTIQANQPADTLVSGLSAQKYFEIVPATTGSAIGLEGYVTQDAVAWNAQLNNNVSEKSAPLMKWNSVNGADGYEVRIYRGAGISNHVATFVTPNNTLVPTGVFSNDDSGESYSWKVRALVYATPTGNTYNYLGVANWDSHPSLQWQRNTAGVKFGANHIVTTADGVQQLQWTPYFTTAPTEGGNRGYQVSYRLVGSGDNGWSNIKVEYPYWIPQTAAGNPLENGEYDFRVAALDANGDAGIYSAIKPFSVTNPAPSNVTVTEEAGTFYVGWNPTKESQGYQVRWKKTSDSAWTNIQSGTAVTKQTALTYSKVVNGTVVGNYEFQVRSLNKGNVWSNYSPSVVANVPNKAINMQTADGATLATNDRTLRWNPVAGASRYLVQVSQSPANVSTVVPQEVIGTSFTPHTALTPGTPYYWRVVAISEAGTAKLTSALANRNIVGVSGVRSFLVTTPPVAAKIKTLTALSGTSMNVEWAPLTGADTGSEQGAKYKVSYRQLSAGDLPWSETIATGWNAGAMTIEGLKPGLTYEFRIQALNDEGSSVWSAVKTGATANAPAAVTSLAVKKKTNTTLTASWRAPRNTGGLAVVGYKVSWKTGSGAWKSANTTSTTYEIKGLKGKTSYRVQVVAINPVGEGTSAVIVQATDPNPKPTAPKTVKLKAKKGKTVIKWSASPKANGPITKYVVQTSTNKKKWKSKTKRIKGADTAKKRKTTSKAGKKGKRLYVRVVAYNASGASKPSRVYSVVRK